MLELGKGTEILADLGGIETIEDAWELFRSKMGVTELAKLEKITTDKALLKIANSIAVCRPDRVMINSGSEADLETIRQLSIAKGEERALAMPDHTIHFDLAQEQARIVDRTFYIVNPDEKISVLAKKILRDEAHAYIDEKMAGIMEGKVLLVGFFNRGPAGAPATIPAIEITSSAYVMHSADMLYRNSYDTFDQQVEDTGFFFTNLHSEGPWRVEDLPNARVFMDRSWLTTYSMFCTYAGNTLLMKKGNHRFAVDLATYFKAGQQLSEHMFITGFKGPGGRATYFCGAAPSGCGKTTTAMAGDFFVGDDLAQMWIADDGSLRAINPERGIFGIVNDVNWDGDPHLMKVLRERGHEVIWTNVLVDDDHKPHWEGSGEDPPAKGRNFQGDWWEGITDPDGKRIPISHGNARITVRCEAIGNFDSEAAESSDGAHVKVITYSGRDSDTMPPIWVAKNANHGVVIGASIVSAATATEIGVSGVRRQPWANAPFIPGALADYMTAQFNLFNSSKLTDPPILAGLNYFLTHQARGGEGFGLLGEKRDVKVWLGWLERRSHGDVEAIETPIGFIPRYEDLEKLFRELIDKDYPRELYDKQFSLYIDKMLARIELQEEAYGKEEDLPAALFEVYAEQRTGLEELKAKFGKIATPEQLGG
ncbi:MAG: phosphoenolpyruvate carboxykinase (GTP) [Thermoanaerobaculales bacterium]|jgi:phosphoenolpyruvate carboxykinase (GTP)|nr:phosphoenolpyruvate carboxykinase (GTP) [Thermoanaerobaculales bacterium]